MFKRLSATLVSVSVIFALLGNTSFAAADKEKKLILLHTSDEHSHLFAVGPEAEDYPLSPNPSSSVYLSGGIGRKLTVLNQLRRAAKAQGYGVLTLSSADILMGTLAHAASIGVSPDYAALKECGYDAVTFGNHEFEIGPEFLGKTIQTAVKNKEIVPIIATNAHFTGDPKASDALLASYLDESGKDFSKPVRRWQVIKTSNGIKVGIVGVLGPAAARYAPGKDPVKFSIGQKKDPNDEEDCLNALYAELQKTVDYLRSKQKVDVVILLAHAGTDANVPGNGESFKIAKNVSGIDVILSGHTHLLMPFQDAVNAKTGKHVIISEPNCFNQYVSKIAISVGAKGKVSYDPAESMVVPITNAIGADTSLQGLLDRTINYLESTEDVPGKGAFLKRSIYAVTGKNINPDSNPGSLYFYPIGKTRFDVLDDNSKAEEWPMLDLVADAFLWQARKYNPSCELSFTANGFTRDAIVKGKTGIISIADIFRVLPLGMSPLDGTFAHPLAIVGLRRDDLKKMLEFSPSLAFQNADMVDYLIVPAGISIKFNMERKPMDRITQIRFTNPKENNIADGEIIYDASKGGWQKGFDEKKIFSVATDYYAILFAFPLYKIPLMKADGSPAELKDIILKRENGNEVKSFEALASFIKELCEAPVNGGYLPLRYSEKKPRRLIPE